MTRNAETAGAGGQGGAGMDERYPDSSTILASPDTPTAYRTVRESAYEAVLNEALDVLARQAIDRAFMAGWIINDSTIPAEQREACRAIADGTTARLIERCRAYEMILRTTPVPELRGGRR